MFGPELTNGSERHEYLLSEKLAQLGVGVDVLTTRTRNSYQTSALSSAWPSDYSEGVEVVTECGLNASRQPSPCRRELGIGYRWRCSKDGGTRKGVMG